MKIIHKVGDTISQSVDFIVDKNRQAAHLNRLKAVIASEQETLDSAFIALGKQYFAVLEGKDSAEKESDTTAVLVELIHESKLRLKKARARYEYTLRYGVPKPGVKGEETIDVDDVDENGNRKEEADDQDITIAYADPAAVCDNAAIDAAIEETLREEAGAALENKKDE